MPPLENSSSHGLPSEACPSSLDRNWPRQAETWDNSRLESTFSGGLTMVGGSHPELGAIPYGLEGSDSGKLIQTAGDFYGGGGG